MAAWSPRSETINNNSPPIVAAYPLVVSSAGMKSTIADGLVLIQELPEPGFSISIMETSREQPEIQFGIKVLGHVGRIEILRVSDGLQ